MIAPLLQFLVCAAVIIVAGTLLSKYGDWIAELTGLGRLLIGSILLAGATSLPELTVDISAVRLGAVDLAVGDLLGSSLMNLLILAMLDLSHHSRGRMLSKQGAAHALPEASSPMSPRKQCRRSAALRQKRCVNLAEQAICRCSGNNLPARKSPFRS